MRSSTLIKKLINVKDVTIKDIYFETNIMGEQDVIVLVELYKNRKCKCGICGKQGSGYDRGDAFKRWRALDCGFVRVYIECRMPRVVCPDHGVVAQKVPWARHRSEFTTYFEEAVTWLARVSNKTVITEFMRINWRTVGSIIKRVYDEKGPTTEDLFGNLKNIGIDETSYKKGHKYLTIVVDHDTGSVIWVGVGKTSDTLDKFFKLLTTEQLANIKVITADGADYIAKSVGKWCPNAVICVDPFHVVCWINDALDDVRKRLWREEMKKAEPKRKRKVGRPKKGEKISVKPTPAQTVKNLRYPLGKNPENLTPTQQVALELIVKSNPYLYKAYLLKEKLRLLFKLPIEDAIKVLDEWLVEAYTSEIPEMVKLQKTITEFKVKILKSIELGLSNARLEGTNSQIKIIIRMAYGFRNIDNLIALIMLRCSTFDIDLPGRKPKIIA